MRTAKRLLFRDDARADVVVERQSAGSNGHRARSTQVRRLNKTGEPLKREANADGIHLPAVRSRTDGERGR